MSATTKTDLFAPGERLNRNPFAELPGCLGHPSVYLVMILDASGEATNIESAWTLRRLAADRMQEVEKAWPGRCWIEVIELNPEAKKRKK